MKYIFILVAILSPVFLSASTTLGSAIYPRHLGNGQFEIDLTLYRSCQGTPTTPSLQLTAAGQNLVLNNAVLVMENNITYFNVSCGDCANDTLGAKKLTYRFVTDLSAYSECEWQIIYKGKSRPDKPSNLAQNQNSHGNFATLNKCLADDKETGGPLGPEAYIRCIREEILETAFIIPEFSGYDSISYSFAQPLDSNLNPLSYASPFSLVRPLTFWGFPNQNLPFPLGFWLDAQKGTLRFTPTQAKERATLAVQARLWKMESGVMTQYKTVVQELTYVFVDCGLNKIPDITGLPSAHTVETAEVCLYFNTFDSNSHDSLLVSWDKSLSGASFSSNNNVTKHPDGQLCWTPEPGTARKEPYVIHASATEKRCPFPSRTSKKYEVFVHGLPEAYRQILIGNCGELIVKLSPNEWVSFAQIRLQDSTGTYVYNKFLDSTYTDTIIVAPGTYRLSTIIRSSIANVRSYADTVYIPLVITLSAKYPQTPRCRKETIELEAIAKAQNNITYQWYKKVNGQWVDLNLNQAVISTVTDTIDTHFKLVATESNGCYKEEEFIVQVTNCVGIKPVIKEYLKLYPNPAAEEISFTFTETEPDIFYLTDALGKKIRVNPISESGNYSLNISYLAGGIYYLLAEKEGIVVAKGRFVKR